MAKWLEWLWINAFESSVGSVLGPQPALNPMIFQSMKGLREVTLREESVTLREESLREVTQATAVCASPTRTPI